MRYRLWLILVALAVLIPACGGDHPTQVAAVAQPAPDGDRAPPTPAGDAFSAELTRVFNEQRLFATLAWNAELDRQRQIQDQARAAANQHRTESRQSQPNRLGSGDGCGGWRGMVAQLWPAGQVPKACRVLMCESTGNPNARNRSGAIGLMQLLGHGGTTDPWQNLSVAYRLWLSQGWSPWVCQ